MYPAYAAPSFVLPRQLGNFRIAKVDLPVCLSPILLSHSEPGEHPPTGPSLQPDRIGATGTPSIQELFSP